MTRRALAIVPVLLVLAACNTALSSDRVEPGDTVTVSQMIAPSPGGTPCMPDAEVVIEVDGAQVATGTSDASGSFTIQITAPADPENYEVQAICTGPTPDPEDGDATTTATLTPANLLVETIVAMAADPTTVAPGATFEVTGNFCVSDTESAVPPEADITFEGETKTATASSPQPFAETWTLELTAPTAPGTYEVTGLCTFEDLITTTTTTIPDQVGAAAIEPSPDGIVGERAYEPIEITVAQDPTTTTTSTTVPVDTAPAAQPRPATPSFTG